MGYSCGLSLLDIQLRCSYIFVYLSCLRKFLSKLRELTTQQTIVFAVLFLSLVFFAVGRWGYDVVVLLALLVVAVTGIVPGKEAFLGFGHPAVITVAAVLVVSRGLMNSGLVDSIARATNSVGKAPILQILALTAFVTVCSAFMNNVGALALLMPVAIRMARNHKRPPSYLLMPLAFGSLLGGMTTLIGTPPNIIIATFRQQSAGIPFRMFDFTPVGFGVVLAGVLFVSLVGWRPIPQRKGQTSREDLFKIQDHISEVRIPEQSKVLGKSLYELEKMTEGDVTVVGSLTRAAIYGDVRASMTVQGDLGRLTAGLICGQVSVVGDLGSLITSSGLVPGLHPVDFVLQNPDPEPDGSLTVGGLIRRIRQA